MPDSEFSFLAMFDRHFSREHEDLLLTRGDDCAVVSWTGQVCISTDLFLENTHFRRDYFSPEDIGHKALAVNLSDIAAMGASVLGFCLGLQAPTNLDDAYWERLLAGMAALARQWDAPCVGGDLSKSEQLGFCITVWGRAPRFVPRGHVRPGDVIFCCGQDSLSGCLPLGLARVGLRELEKDIPGQGVNAKNAFPRCTEAHLRPQPLMRQGILLSAHPGVRSLMDVSDGLIRDLPRLLGTELTPGNGPRSTSGACLELSPQDLHPEIITCFPTPSMALEQTLLGGEDYCLMGVCSPEAVADLQAGLACFHVLGRVTEQPEILINSKPLPGAGFDHFRT